MIFLESPWPILVVGIVVETILVILLLRSGRGVLLWPMAGVILATVLGLLLERSWVTDTKRIRQSLEEVCAALAANDYQRVAKTLTPKADGDRTRSEAQYVLGLAEFKNFSLRNVVVVFNTNTPLPTAKVTFTVMVQAHLRHDGDMPGDVTRPARIQVTMRKEGDRWVIVDHRILQDPRDG